MSGEGKMSKDFPFPGETQTKVKENEGLPKESNITYPISGTLVGDKNTFPPKKGDGWERFSVYTRARLKEDSSAPLLTFDDPESKLESQQICRRFGANSIESGGLSKPKKRKYNQSLRRCGSSQRQDRIPKRNIKTKRT